MTGQLVRIEPRRCATDARVKGEIKAALRRGETVIAARPNGRFYGVDLAKDDRLVFDEEPARIPLGATYGSRGFMIRRDRG